MLWILVYVLIAVLIGVILAMSFELEGSVDDNDRMYYIAVGMILWPFALPIMVVILMVQMMMDFSRMVVKRK